MVYKIIISMYFDIMHPITYNMKIMFTTSLVTVVHKVKGH